MKNLILAPAGLQKDTCARTEAKSTAPAKKGKFAGNGFIALFSNELRKAGESFEMESSEAMASGSFPLSIIGKNSKSKENDKTHSLSSLHTPTTSNNRGSNKLAHLLRIVASPEETLQGTTEKQANTFANKSVSNHSPKENPGRVDKEIQPAKNKSEAAATIHRKSNIVQGELVNEVSEAKTGQSIESIKLNGTESKTAKAISAGEGSKTIGTSGKNPELVGKTAKPKSFEQSTDNTNQTLKKASAGFSFSKETKSMNPARASKITGKLMSYSGIVANPEENEKSSVEPNPKVVKKENTITGLKTANAQPKRSPTGVVPKSSMPDILIDGTVSKPAAEEKPNTAGLTKELKIESNNTGKHSKITQSANNTQSEQVSVAKTDPKQETVRHNINQNVNNEQNPDNKNNESAKNPANNFFENTKEQLYKNKQQNNSGKQSVISKDTTAKHETTSKSDLAGNIAKPAEIQVEKLVARIKANDIKPASAESGPGTNQLTEPSQITQKTVRIAKGLNADGSAKARLILKPPSLGTVFVDINMNSAVANIKFRADSREIVRAIEKQIVVLREKLSHEGIRTDQIDVKLRENEEQSHSDGTNSRDFGKERRHGAERRKFIDSFAEKTGPENKSGTEFKDLIED